MMVIRKSREAFRVSSASQQDRYYKVENQAPGVWTCTCPHFQCREWVTECKHIEAVQKAVENRNYEDDEISGIQRQILGMHCELGKLTDRLNEIQEA